MASKCKTPNSMKWHPLMVKWCLYLHYKSRSAYETLRESGCLKLPSHRTLQDYTHVVKSSTGFSTDVDKQLMITAQIESLKEWEKCVVIILDQMSIHEDLVYDKNSDELVGFTDLGDINNHLLKFKKCVGEPVTPTLANSMLVFMVQGLFVSIGFPYAQFPSHSITGDLLFNPIWEAVFRLERCGFKVAF